MSDNPVSESEAQLPVSSKPLLNEDWTAALLGVVVALGTLVLVSLQVSDSTSEEMAEYKALKSEATKLHREQPDSDQAVALRKQLKKQEANVVSNPAKPYLMKVGKWSDSPMKALGVTGEKSLLVELTPLLGSFGLLLVLFLISRWCAAVPVVRSIVPFAVMFLLATIAYLMANQEVIKSSSLEYPLWALLVGLVISNTVGTPEWLKPAVTTEFYIKTGLVLYGAAILIGKLLVLGVPGIAVAWIVTPIVLISTYWFGRHVLKISSPSLTMTIAADMSVCGVSAAIATGAACKAKKEELSLAIGLSLSFTVIMMIVMPVVVSALNLDPLVGGAWIGGTIDATGAVAAAGAALGGDAEAVAVTVKMIQNILIGLTAFGVATYWVWCVERGAETSVGVGEIWKRFPKFILGFFLLSLIFTLVSSSGESGPFMVKSTISYTTDILRRWLFCLAFVAIGLESNFKALAKPLQGGKPLVLYVVGQSLNILLTFLMSMLMFGYLFRSWVLEQMG